MLPSFDDYLNVKNLRYQSIPPRDIGDQIILQSDSRDTLGDTQPKIVVSDTTFP